MGAGTRKQRRLTQEDTDKYLTCPRCGAKIGEGTTRYVEKIEVWRKVKGVVDGHLSIESAYQSGEGYDSVVEGSEYLECHAHVGPAECLNEWKLPERILEMIEWA